MTDPHDQTIDDDRLRAYIADTLSPTETATVERRLREDPELASRLEHLRHARELDPHVHTLGAVWRRRRLSCVSREQLGSHLLGVLPDGLSEYIEFHIGELECPFCTANLTDLKAKMDLEPTLATPPERKARYFHTSRAYLPGQGTRGLPEREKGR